MRHWGRAWKEEDPGGLSVPGEIWDGRGEPPYARCPVVTQVACPVNIFDTWMHQLWQVFL